MEMEFDAWGNYAADDDKPHHVRLTGSGNGNDTNVVVSGAGGLGKSAAAVFIAGLSSYSTQFHPAAFKFLTNFFQFWLPSTLPSKKERVMLISLKKFNVSC